MESSEQSIPRANDLEDFFRKRLALGLRIDESELTPEFLEMLEHEVEFEAHPMGPINPAFCRYLSPSEILARRERTELLLKGIIEVEG